MQACNTSEWQTSLVSASLGIIAALITPIVKDLVIRRSNDRRAKTNAQREVFRNYAAPLIASCEALLWRLGEIFLEGRHQFLKTATLPLVYNEYKRQSTLYRISGVLGWIRAMHLELSALPRGESQFLSPISDAIDNVRHVLADGPTVELHRLRQVCTVWGFDLRTLTGNHEGQLATRFEIELYNIAGDELKHDSNLMKQLPFDEKLRICRTLADFLSGELRIAKIDGPVIAETVNRAIQALSFREALIYRDWQDAIGDAVLLRDEDSARRYKLLGYQQFVEVLNNGTLWMDVFRGSIDDIDFDAVDRNDSRVAQLRALAAGVATILLKLSEGEDGDLINLKVLEIAKRLSAQN